MKEMTELSKSRNFTNHLLRLPNDILGIIVDHLIADSYLSLETFDENEHISYSLTTKKCYVRINSKNVESLMNVHRSLRSFVRSRFNSQVCAVSRLLTHLNSLELDNDIFVFDRNCNYKQFDVILEYFNFEGFHDLDHCQNIWLSDSDWTVPTLLGSSWVKGTIKCPVRFLTSIVIDFEITLRLFRYGSNMSYTMTDEESDENYQSRILKNVKFNDFPPFLKTLLEDDHIYDAYKAYKLQLFFNSLAKVVAFQDVIPAFTILDKNGYLFEIASLLWAFQNHNVSSCVKKLDIIAYFFSKPHDLFSTYLAGLNKLEVLSFDCCLNSFDGNDGLSMKDIVSVLPKLQSLKQLVLYTNYVPSTPILFPHGIRRLHTTDSTLLSISMTPLSARILNVVELSIDFYGSFMNSFCRDSTFLRLPNLKTLILKGEIGLNLQFLSLFFEANPTITAVSLNLFESFDFLPSLFSHMSHVECLEVSIATRLLEDYSFNVAEFVVNQALLALSSMSVLICNTMPYRMPLQKLISSLTESLLHKTRNLTTIIFHGTGSALIENNYREAFFADVPNSNSYGYLMLKDFTEAAFVWPEPLVKNKKAFSAHKLIMNVVTLRELSQHRRWPRFWITQYDHNFSTQDP
jgi:hypothetical protein